MKHLTTTLFTLICIVTLITTSAFAGSIIYTQTDYATGLLGAHETAETVSSDVMPIHQDSSVKTDGSDIYVLEARGADTVTKINPADMSVVYQYSVGVDSNPKDIVFYGSDAYVMLYDTPKILMVDPNATSEAAFVKSEIDISQWADSDGSPEAIMGFAHSGLIYVVLQRYDLNTYTAGTAALIAIDPETQAIVDFNDTDEGIQGIDLILKNPQWGAITGNHLFLGGTSYGVTDEGVMKIDLNDSSAMTQTKVFSESDNASTMAGLYVFDDTTGVIAAFDENWNAVPYRFNPSTGEVSDALPVPDAGGGVAFNDGVIYVGARDFNGPAIYRVDAVSNALIGEKTPTTLPPYSIMYFESGTTAVDESDATPAAFEINTVMPNPFNPTTSISFTLNEGAQVNAEIFNSTGQKIDTLVKSHFSAGNHTLNWNASAMPSGIYFVRISSGGSSVSAKMTLLK